MARRLVVSQAAQARLAAARDFLAAQLRPTGAPQPLLVLAAGMDAASELVQQFALTQPRAIFGLRRMTLRQLVRQLAAELLAEEGRTPLGALGSEALCARVAHALARDGKLERLQALANQPGWPRALSRTLRELRLAEVESPADPGLRNALRAYQAELAHASLADEVEMLKVALTAGSALLAQPVLLLDLGLRSPLEARLLARFTGPLFASLPAGDERSARLFREELGLAPELLEVPGDTGLARVQRHLFTETTSPRAEPSDAVEVLSAPGEGRECAEIARRILWQAGQGVPFDRIAILLRSPALYRGLLEEALARARIPGYFATGTRRPDPAGRAFLSLLDCAAERLSARRFAEYLSLGEVPQAASSGAPPEPAPRGDRFRAPLDELDEAWPGSGLAEDAPPERPPTDAPPEASPEAQVDLQAPVVEGSLRAPWRWEKLLVDAAVIGGLHRWESRLSGLHEELQLQLRLGGLEDETRRERLRGSLDDLAALRAFALPLLGILAALPAQAPWGDYLDQLSALATQSLLHPERVLSLLAELAPMAPVGPVTLGEVRQVLGRRLTELVVPAPARRHGQVFVGPVEAARGMEFDLVFVPGLAEKLFPQKVLQDPLLRDAERSGFPGLERREDRVEGERLALRIAVGAARQRLVLSYPRIELSPARPRVPSFYGLEVLRAAEGQLPGFAALSRRAGVSAGARIGWPAPAQAELAIDEAEHDLALLEETFRKPREKSRGTASYLLESNPHLRRALRARARRWRSRWTGADGLVEPSPEALAALALHLPSARSYSPTGLQHYAECPYKFLLQAVHRLQPRQEPVRAEELEPMVRGSLMHETQFELMRELQESGSLPLTLAGLGDARERLERILKIIAARFRDQLAPAIPRVWEDGVLSVRTDLREWLRRQAETSGPLPWRFELSFGLPDLQRRDVHSAQEAVALEEGLRVRGSIDLVERHLAGSLRATDYKSGRVRAKDGAVIGGGALLQPALYALVLEKLFPGVAVSGGRLYYCTFAGDFTEVEIPLDLQTRESVRTLAQTVGRALAEGFLPAAPRDGECQRCDYLAVCGPHEEFRTRRKPADRLIPLVALRGMP